MVKRLKEQLKTKGFWLRLASVLVLTIGIPVLINESYKASKVLYTTVWDGAVFLTYYGTLLGATATIWVLNRTIQFSHRQIRYDRFFQREETKWQRIESMCDDFLRDIKPIKLNEIYTATLLRGAETMVNPDFTVFVVNMKSSYDSLVSNLNEKDKKQLQQFLSETQKLCLATGKIADEYQEILEKMRSIISKYNEPVVSNYLQPLNARAMDLIKQANNLQENDYTALLRLKRDCFSAIYIDIEERAEKFL